MLVSEIGYVNTNPHVQDVVIKQQTSKSNLTEGFGNQNKSEISGTNAYILRVCKSIKSLFSPKVSDKTSSGLSVIG